MDYGDMHSPLFRFRAGSTKDNIFIFGGQYYEILDDGSYIYPITSNITLATVFPHETPKGRVDAPAGEKEEDSAALPLMAWGPVSLALVNALRAF